MTIAGSSPYNSGRMVHAPQAANGLAIVRVTIGAMFVWVFFENLGKGLYTPAGYANLIHYYIKNSHSPAVWKSVMALAASHAAMAAPAQAVTEISLVSCSSSACLRGRRLLWRFCISAAYGFRSGARRGYGSCWFRCSRRLGSLSDAPGGDGEWTRGWRNAGHLRFGGNQGGDRGSDWAKFTRECPSLSPPIMKRRRLRAF